MSHPYVQYRMEVQKNVTLMRLHIFMDIFMKFYSELTIEMILDEFMCITYQCFYAVNNASTGAHMGKQRMVFMLFPDLSCHDELGRIKFRNSGNYKILVVMQPRYRQEIENYKWSAHFIEIINQIYIGNWNTALIARFMGPALGPSGTDRTGPRTGQDRTGPRWAPCRLHELDGHLLARFPLTNKQHAYCGQTTFWIIVIVAVIMEKSSVQPVIFQANSTDGKSI